MITISKPYLPPLEEFNQYLEGIWNRSWITNNGPLVTELEHRLTEFLGVAHVLLVSSGTAALQIALRSLQLKGEIITTAFSHVVTANAVLWSNCKPVFADIEKKYFCIDPDKIEAAITRDTCAILATHVYGFPCQVKKIQAIADRYHLKVIYDGAHAFGVKVNGQSVLSSGDVTAVSFHATKVYHTIEGGAIITNNQQIAETCALLRTFGVSGAVGSIGAECIVAGTNGKNSEFHAAMGLCNLPRVNDFIEKQKQLSEVYYTLLKGLDLQFPAPPPDTLHNFAYFPVLFPSHTVMLSIRDALAAAGIEARRYFYPSLNELPFLQGASCPVSEEVSQQILCLPMYYALSFEEVKAVAEVIRIVMSNMAISTIAV
ncbi:MAG: DegT/DnrJ/EryC1/StrS family aminotransferase [Chitinophagaceae bacterium]